MCWQMPEWVGKCRCKHRHLHNNVPEFWFGTGLDYAPVVIYTFSGKALCR
jgi:hypothetical protein